VDLDILVDTPPWEWPANTGEFLVTTLRDQRIATSRRTIAAQLAGDLVVMNDEIATLLAAIVRSQDEPEELRAKAAISLGPVLEETDIEGFDDPISEPSIEEKTFDLIQETLRQIYNDERAPKLVRRRVLEASVRAPQNWHEDAIRAAYSRDDEDWKLTATFCMRYVRGFDDQILEMLENPNPDIHYEAVLAAGASELDLAWPHVAALIAFENIEKRLLLAAIEAAASIRPLEAAELLGDLAGSEDEEIAEAVSEALSMARGHSGEFDDEDEDEGSVH
jgi:hypothetical protein